MLERPLVSALIPTHDGERYVAEAIRSVLAQRYRPLELVVVDDESTDATAEIAARVPEVRLLRQAHAGVAAARNAAVAAARGAILAFLDQDDRWTEDKLELQVPPLLEDDSLDYTLGLQRLELEDGVAPPPWLAAADLREEHVGYFPGTLVVRRRAFERVGGFRPEAVPAEGADWFLRANERGLGKRIVPHLVLRKRIHDANQSGDQREVRAQVLRAIHRSLERRRTGTT
jgi:glycosyltransferase involved in cell wall biosynthesis